jgi:hypothetical protein
MPAAVHESGCGAFETCRDVRPGSVMRSRADIVASNNRRGFVTVKTGNGPDSHIGDFESEADAKDWISTKSKYWPGKPAAPK